jgi:hypothetical protein
MVNHGHDKKERKKFCKEKRCEVQRWHAKAISRYIPERTRQCFCFEKQFDFIAQTKKNFQLLQHLTCMFWFGFIS